MNINNNNNYILLYGNVSCKNKSQDNNANLKLEKKDDKFVRNNNVSTPYSTSYINDSYKLKLLEKIKSAYGQPISENPTNTNEINRIQQGRLGVVRDSNELSSKDLKTLIDSQLMLTKTEDIEKIINSYPKDKQDLARKALNKFTQWGSINSIDNIFFKLLEYRKNDENIFSDDMPSLSTTLKYFVNFKKLYNQALYFSNEKGILVLDELTLSRLENDEVFRNKVKDFKIVYPQGWINGINAFNQTDDIKTKFDIFMNDINLQKKENETLSDEDVIANALNKPIIDRLKKINLDKNLVIFENYDCFYPKNVVPTSKDITFNLNQNPITVEHLEKNISEFQEEHRPYVRELLAQNLNVNSLKSMNVKLKELYEKIIDSNGGSDDGIYYYIPTKNKSYSTVLMQYMLVNNIDMNKVVLVNDKVKLPSDCRNLVVVDDYAGTGNSLVTVAKNLELKFNYDGINSKITVVPLLATKSGLNLCQNTATTITQDLITKFTDSDYFNSLSDINKNIFIDLLGYQGYDHTTACVAFPYMAPDNNCEFFYTNFADMFTLHGKGIKNFNI